MARFDPIVAPRSFRRTPTEALRDHLYERRAEGAPREIRLPIRAAPDHRLVGCPPTGMFKFVTEEDRDAAARP